MNEPSKQPPKTTLWWAIWLLALAVTGVAFLVIGLPTPRPPDTMTTVPSEVMTLIPLGLSIMVRWGGLSLVRRNRALALGLFILGVLLAVVAAHMSLLLGEHFGRQLFTLSALAIAQYVPLFARAYYDS